MATAAGNQGCFRTLVPDPSVFAPTKLNTDQWISSMKDLGIKYAVLVAKHNCGFCTWPTAVNFPSFGFTYNYSVNSSTYHGDVVKQFVESCTKNGIKPGFYYSVVTNSFLNVANGKVAGGPLSVGQVAVTQEQYYEIVVSQLLELWTQYGNLAEIWFDGGYQQDLSNTIIQLLKEKQPNAVIFNGYGVTTNPVRWIGTETGHAPYPNWATGTSNGGDPTSPVWCPPECDFTLQKYDLWFYNHLVGVHTLQELVSIYHDSVGRGCNFLIDFAPTPDGVLPDEAVAQYKNLGDFLNKCYGTPVAFVAGQGDSIILNLKSEAQIDRVIIQEDISLGQRVRAYLVEGFIGGVWTKVSNGTSIGNKRIDIFNPVSVTQLRLTATQSVEQPVWYNFAAFHPCTIPTTS
eukprot:TRINITY_DN16005_c0_g1_i1.p1 TRINITY_DN16005_c0_g1~~TRINITY_DN16005_c0_g1_i1.p1  ORF type:complete len:461 (+),score=96.01 TRINITY_DN16005_c0_g1_i1:179-1384(+)